MQTKQPGRRGFSLLEVLLGGILFSTIMVYLASIWGIHARTMGHTRDRMVATFIAGQQIENCITAGFRNVDMMAAAGAQQADMTTTINGVAQSVSYEYLIETQQHPDPLLADKMKIVTVHVKFAENSKIGGKSEIVFRTMLSDI